MAKLTDGLYVRLKAARNAVDGVVSLTAGQTRHLAVRESLFEPAEDAGFNMFRITGKGMAALAEHEQCLAL